MNSRIFVNNFNLDIFLNHCFKIFKVMLINWTHIAKCYQNESNLLLFISQLIKKEIQFSIVNNSILIILNNNNLNMLSLFNNIKYFLIFFFCQNHMHTFCCQTFYFCAIIEKKKKKKTWLDHLLWFTFDWLYDWLQSFEVGGREFQLDCFRRFSLEHSII